MNNLGNFRFDVLTDVAKQFSFLKRIPLLPIIVDEQIKWMTFFFRPTVFFIMSSITNEVKNWEGVSTFYHRFGGLQFNVTEKEIGHLHGNGLLDVWIPKKLKGEIGKLSFVEEHHMISNSNWISIKIKSSSSIERILNLLREVYNERLD